MVLLESDVLFYFQAVQEGKKRSVRAEPHRVPPEYLNGTRSIRRLIGLQVNRPIVMIGFKTETISEFGGSAPSSGLVPAWPQH